MCNNRNSNHNSNNSNTNNNNDGNDNNSNKVHEEGRVTTGRSVETQELLQKGLCRTLSSYALTYAALRDQGRILWVIPLI